MHTNSGSRQISLGSDRKDRKSVAQSIHQDDDDGKKAGAGEGWQRIDLIRRQISVEPW